MALKITKSQLRVILFLCFFASIFFFFYLVERFSERKSFADYSKAEKTLLKIYALEQDYFAKYGGYTKNLKELGYKPALDPGVLVGFTDTCVNKNAVPKEFGNELLWSESEKLPIAQNFQKDRAHILIAFRDMPEADCSKSSFLAIALEYAPGGQIILRQIDQQKKF